MWSQRNVVSHALQRRSTLEALRRSSRTLTPSDACDADPMLIRAALHHGERRGGGERRDREASRRPVSVECPVCDHELVDLRYVFGEQLGQYSGRIKNLTELAEMAHQYGEFKVVVVEVCTECGWNHMIESYVLGDGVKRRPPRRQPTVEDIYG